MQSRNETSARRGAAVAAAAAALGLSVVTAAPAQAQTADGAPFGGFRHDATQPIEITADRLAVNRDAATATFEGEVIAGQGTLRLTADSIVVNYAAEGAAAGGSIERLRAEGDVFLTSGGETAKGAWADYDVAAGTIRMGGDVVLTQGENAISGERLTIDLEAGTGAIEGGRVRSVFTPPAAGGGTENGGGDGG